MRLLVKSRLNDGRLRIAYGDSRDAAETIGVVEARGVAGPAALAKPKRGARAADRAGAKVVSTTATSTINSPEQQQQYQVSGKIEGEEGHQGHLWAAAVEGAFGKHLLEEGQEEKQGDPDPLSVSRQGSVASLLSDLSSGELLQRHPPSPGGGGQHVEGGLQPPPPGELFLAHERADIFRNVLPELLGKEAAEHDAARGPALAVAEMLDALRTSVSAALDGLADRHDRQMQAVVDLLHHHHQQQQQQQHMVVRSPASLHPQSPFRP